ncbi:MAG: 3-deoxy-D-manno-octulosonic acid transferase [Tabrizicola sp.]|nr:3-deoxy-D-manno-octulosonic acid transferase [Tabrizicola sp.]
MVFGGLRGAGRRHDELEAEPVDSARPAGRLAWLHAPSDPAVKTLMALAQRMIEEDDLSVILTSPVDFPTRPGIAVEKPPADSAAEARAFLDHWRPEIAVFSDGEIRPALLHEANARNIPLMMVDAREPVLVRDREGWFPGLMRSALSLFSHVGAIDETSARAFRKAGAPLSAVAVTGRMEEESAALSCLEAERAALAKLFATRPVWFAACLPEAEEKAILHAHRTALQLAHRLLLIVMPRDLSRAEGLRHLMEETENWAVAMRSEDQEPDPETEVFVVDNPDEYGLWYRLSPITFIGGTLLGGGAGRNPLEAASLGSAILHGPRPGHYADTFLRLKAARATRQVGSAEDLSDALGILLGTRPRRRCWPSPPGAWHRMAPRSPSGPCR